MFGIADRIFGRKKQDIDYGDVKTHVLGKPFVEQPETIGSKLGMEPAEFPRDPYAPEPFTSPPSQLFPVQGRRQDFPDEPRFGIDRPALSNDQPRTMDILDRLSIIESQLQAIRSQTETINERLKNIDARLGRRY